MKYKNIAIVVTNLAGSGAEKVAITQAKLFKEKGHNVILFLLEDIKNYNTSDCDFPIIPLTKRKDTYKFLGKIGDYIYAQILQNKIKSLNIKFDIVFSHLPRADRMVKLLKHSNKYFVIHMSYKAELSKFKSSRVKKKLKLYQKNYQNENIITVSRAIIKDFDELNIQYKNAITIYNPFYIDEIRKKGNVAVEIDFQYIISPSAFREQKRYDVMLDAFKMLEHNIKLVILAKNDDKLIQMIKDRHLEDKVIILGFQQNPYKYIKNASLLVLSSDREGLPTVVIESLILGTPVVSTDCPTGPSEILTGDLAYWLVPVQNPSVLAAKIDEALGIKINIQDKDINKFDKEYIYQEYKRLWEK